MPRFALMLALVFGLMLVTPAVANAQDRDCSDFDSQAEAQDFYENAGPGDPHRLDADDDGRACDSNPCPCRGPRQSTEYWAPRSAIFGAVEAMEVNPASRSGRRPSAPGSFV